MFLIVNYYHHRHLHRFHVVLLFSDLSGSDVHPQKSDYVLSPCHNQASHDEDIPFPKRNGVTFQPTTRSKLPDRKPFTISTWTDTPLPTRNDEDIPLPTRQDEDVPLPKRNEVTTYNSTLSSKLPDIKPFTISTWSDTPLQRTKPWTMQNQNDFIPKEIEINPEIQKSCRDVPTAATKPSGLPKHTKEHNEEENMALQDRWPFTNRIWTDASTPAAITSLLKKNYVGTKDTTVLPGRRTFTTRTWTDASTPVAITSLLKNNYVGTKETTVLPDKRTFTTWTDASTPATIPSALPKHTKEHNKEDNMALPERMTFTTWTNASTPATTPSPLQTRNKRGINENLLPGRRSFDINTWTEMHSPSILPLKRKSMDSLTLEREHNMKYLKPEQFAFENLPKESVANANSYIDKSRSQRKYEKLSLEVSDRKDGEQISLKEEQYLTGSNKEDVSTFATVRSRFNIVNIQCFLVTYHSCPALHL